MFLIRWLQSLFLIVISLGFIALVSVTGLVFWYLAYVGRDLPDFHALKDYEPPVVTRVHTGDGRLMAEFSTERRVFVPIDEIPPLVIQAFLSAEDKNFYTHQGVDFQAIVRAMVVNLKNAGAGRRPIGASTITQQVAKNFLLTNEVSYERKIKEAILAMRLERALSKQRLLELYLNQIYLGVGNYGVAAAALYYFNKSLDELTIPEVAYLAALPKAPNNYHPVKQAKAALERRNWVIERMVETGAITKDQAQLAELVPLQMVGREVSAVRAPYFAEEIRREIQETYGDDVLYRGGLSVRSTMNPELQTLAESALRHGLMAYDMKQGWRGPVTRIEDVQVDLPAKLGALKRPVAMLPEWQLAAVTAVNASDVRLGLAGNAKGKITLDDLKWARPVAGSGAEITHPNQVVAVGDVVMVAADPGKPGIYVLRQIPKIQGAIVALDPHTGRVLAMQGGWAFDTSEFNRVTQAWRQPGSAFKPFIYLAALDHGFTPSSLVLDGPITYTDAVGNVWQPVNYSGEYYGPSTLRVGIEKSRNLMTVRLADKLGMKTVVDYAKKFGINENMQPHLANALGSTETTLLRLSAAYGMLVNGGKQITPQFIDRIQDRRGNSMTRRVGATCDTCGPKIRWEGQEVPELMDSRPQLQDPRTAYQMVSILEGVVERGTATKLRDLGRPVAGKTGTTNESRDVWFVGFTPDLVAGVFVGFDQPQPLGDKETGGSLAVPIFKEFMAGATLDTPPTPFRVPPGMRQVMVNPGNGRAVSFGTPGAIWESFVEGTEPGESSDYSVLGGGLVPDAHTSDAIGNPDYVAPAPYPQAAPGEMWSNDSAAPPDSAPVESSPAAGDGTGGLY